MIRVESISRSRHEDFESNVCSTILIVLNTRSRVRDVSVVEAVGRSESEAVRDKRSSLKVHRGPK